MWQSLAASVPIATGICLVAFIWRKRSGNAGLHGFSVGAMALAAALSIDFIAMGGYKGQGIRLLGALAMLAAAAGLVGLFAMLRRTSSSHSLAT